MSTRSLHIIHKSLHIATRVHMRILRRLFGMKDEPEEITTRYPLIYCFWASDSEPISKSDAKVLYDVNNLICRSCRGCQ